MTNREILNKLSNEQLIASLVPLSCPPNTTGDITHRCADRRYTPDNDRCNICWIDWLGEEVVGDAE